MARPWTKCDGGWPTGDFPAPEGATQAGQAAWPAPRTHVPNLGMIDKPVVYDYR
jgi:hypothetical protein